MLELEALSNDREALLSKVPTLTEEDLVIIFKRLANHEERLTCLDLVAEDFVTHPRFNLNVLNRIMSEENTGNLKKYIFVAAANTENEEIHKTVLESKKNINDIINNGNIKIVSSLIANFPNLTDGDLISIFQRFCNYRAYRSDIAEKFVAHPSFNLSVLNWVIKNEGKCLKNMIFVEAAKSTNNKEIYNVLYSLGKKSILCVFVKSFKIFQKIF